MCPEIEQTNTPLGLIVDFDLTLSNRFAVVPHSSGRATERVTRRNPVSEYVPLGPGDWVVRDAAKGGVGRSLIALAHERGLRTINLVRDPKVADELKQSGADIVVPPDPARPARYAT